MKLHGGKIVLTAAMVLICACSKQRPVGTIPSDDPFAAVRAGPPLATDRLWVLERTGPSPSDTMVIFARRAGRRIIMRHGPPDNAIFLELNFPADTAAGGMETVQVTVRPLPGRYAVAVESPSILPAGAKGIFSYAMHFATPSEATARYPTPTRFEQALSAGLQTADGSVQLLPSTRPAIDMMQFPLATPGTYQLVTLK